MATNLYLENEVPSLKFARSLRTKLPMRLVGASNNHVIEGNLTVNGTLSAGAESVTSELLTVASANAFAVGANGLTNPAFNVDTSTASVATGLNVKGAAAAAGLALSVLSSGSNENLTIDAKGTGTITLAGTSTGAVKINSSGVITSASANALAVGPNGTTTPILNVDTSVANAVGGLNIQGLASGAGGVKVSVISSESATDLQLDAKSGGQVKIGFTSSGELVANRNIFGNGNLTLQKLTAIPAGGTQDVGLMFSSTAHFGVFFGSGAPTLSAAQGSLYIRSDGSSTSTRLYVNTNGTTGWTNVTTAT